MWALISLLNIKQPLGNDGGFQQAIVFKGTIHYAWAQVKVALSQVLLVSGPGLFF